MIKAGTHTSKDDRARKAKNLPSNSRFPLEHWKEQPDAHDYPAASDYLSLLLGENETASTIAWLQAAPIIHRKAKDLLRAAGLPTLPANNVHVALDLQHVQKGRRLSPVLLVRGSAERGIALVIADGYHRICASWLLDEDADVPCRLVGLDGR